jgi:hypothetical protein
LTFSSCCCSSSLVNSTGFSRVLVSPLNSLLLRQRWFGGRKWRCPIKQILFWILFEQGSLSQRTHAW